MECDRAAAIIEQMGIKVWVSLESAADAAQRLSNLRWFDVPRRSLIEV